MLLLNKYENLQGSENGRVVTIVVAIHLDNGRGVTHCLTTTGSRSCFFYKGRRTSIDHLTNQSHDFLKAVVKQLVYRTAK